MKILESIDIHNYKCLEAVKLNNCKDFNILIGPSNVGKTAILDAINKLSQIVHTQGTMRAESCCSPIVKSIYDSGRFKFSFAIPIDANEPRFRNTPIALKYLFNSRYPSHQLKKFAEFHSWITTANPSYIKHLEDHDKTLSTIELFQPSISESLHMKQITRLLDPEAVPYVKNVLSIENDRITIYKGNQIRNHLSNKNMPKKKWNDLISLIQNTVDMRIDDYTDNHNLQFKDSWEDELEKQGSGVRSLICMAADILMQKKDGIVLIDEPESGLNAKSKQAFINFLMKQQDKQFFIATHDQTFVNPILWNKDELAVFMYSPIGNDNPNFIKVDLHQSQEDPAMFCGYLPHTAELRKAHIYVEGTKDVHKFREILINYLKTHSKNHWLTIYERIGVFHMAGENWQHFLYTVPDQPFISMVLLDTDKKDNVKDIIEKYKQISLQEFTYCDSTAKVAETFDNNKFPIFCISSGQVEELPAELEKLPQEINELINIFLQKSRP